MILVRKIMKIFKDMLTERGKYSQGRVYLFWSVLAYYITLGILLFAGMNKHSNVDVDKFKLITEALEYAMVLFGGYVFGGKFLDMVKVVGTNKSETKS
tara:strand:+ start:756 stop:1049 length:294 start_codon:yes stop_codon:yes gene_type:complete